jgi:hypothetical protein
LKKTKGRKRMNQDISEEVIGMFAERFSLQFKLEDFLTKEQLNDVKNYRKEMMKKGIRPLGIIYTNGLKTMFNKLHKQLIEKGIFPDYLAYIVSYIHSREIKLGN